MIKKFIDKLLGKPAAAHAKKTSPLGKRVEVAADVAAFAGTVVESLLGREGASWRVTNGHVLNLYNTLAGAAVAALIARVVF